MRVLLWLTSRKYHEIDIAVALVVTCSILLASNKFHVPGSIPDAQGFWLTVLINMSLAARRRFPVAVLLISGLGYSQFLILNGEPSLNVWGPIIAFYTVAVLRPPEIARSAMLFAMLLLLQSGLSAEGFSIVATIAQALIMPIVIWVFGSNTRVLAERGEQLTELTRQLQLEQEDRAQRAVTEERVAIARELHDVVAHHMSVISVHAGLARYVFDTDRETALQALDTAAETSREALDEMRRLLGVLRISPDSASTYDAAAGLGQLGELATRMTSAGVPVTVTTAGPYRALPQGPDLCAYRVVQESLTNVLKHAHPASAEVVVSYSSSTVRVSITNTASRASNRPGGNGHPLTPKPVSGKAGAGKPGGQVPAGAAALHATGAAGFSPVLRTGHGLIGMRERARVYGGTLAAGPRPGGGFEVVLTLPLTYMSTHEAPGTSATTRNSPGTPLST
jgi:signal transduction histidine kinase